MEHTQSHHHHKKHSHKVEPGTLTRIITVIAFILLIAVMVFYLKNKKDEQSPVKFIPEKKQNILDISAPTENLAGPVDEMAKPETIDLSLVESDLSQTDRNLETIDTLDNI